jgi:hypothetical protein
MFDILKASNKTMVFSTTSFKDGGTGTALLAQVFEWLAEYMDGSREVSTLETKASWLGGSFFSTIQKDTKGMIG